MISLPISYIHSLNVVHRDLKPDNILVSSIGSNKIYILSDFEVSAQNLNDQSTTLKNKIKDGYDSSMEKSDQEDEPNVDMLALG